MLALFLQLAEWEWETSVYLASVNSLKKVTNILSIHKITCRHEEHSGEVVLIVISNCIWNCLPIWLMCMLRGGRGTFSMLQMIQSDIPLMCTEIHNIIHPVCSTKWGTPGIFGSFYEYEGLKKKLSHSIKIPWWFLSLYKQCLLVVGGKLPFSMYSVKTIQHITIYILVVVTIKTQISSMMKEIGQRLTGVFLRRVSPGSWDNHVEISLFNF